MSEYSQDSFYTHATDKKGHCVQVRVALPPGVMDMLGELVASQTIPDYKTAQHVLRDALFHRLQWLKENHKVDTAAPMSVWEAQIRSEKLRERYSSARLVVENVRESFHAARGTNELVHVQKEIDELLLSDLPEPAKQQLRDLF